MHASAEQIHSCFSIEQILFNRLGSVSDNEAASLYRRAVPAVSPTRPLRAPSSLRGLLEDRELEEIERAWPDGMTSRQIVDVFETRGIRFSEATLRKYVQLGLLPRSVRVGRKGKHRGSCGLYPSHVIRRVNVVKGMMAEDRTIEEIQRSFARFKDDIEMRREASARPDQRLRARGEGADGRPPTGGASWNARSPRPSAPPASWCGASPASSDEFLHTSNRLPAALRPAAGATCIDRG